jgi:serine/threonine-protein kinase RsbW
MPPHPQRTDVTLESRLDSITVAENICTRMAESAGFGEDDCYRISMAVREGVVNAFHWGNEEQSDKKIFLTLQVQENKLVVSITDQGRGFDVSDIPDPLAEDNILKTSGRGIFLMRTFMDEWMVRRSNEGGAMLVMAKRLPNP